MLPSTRRNKITQTAERAMNATIWKNGATEQIGQFYGLRISLDDRDRHFKRMWHEIEVVIHGAIHRFEIGATFWTGSPVIRDNDKKPIRSWVAENSSLTWPPFEPPTVTLEPLGDVRFRLMA
jgi:hypothetical protein